MSNGFMTNEEQLRRTCIAYEKKLIELMGMDAFMAYSTEIAKDLFAQEICEMPDSDFKEKTLDNFDLITGSAEDFQKLLGNIQKSHRDCENCAHCIPAGNVNFCELPDCEFKPLGEEDDDA